MRSLTRRATRVTTSSLGVAAWVGLAVSVGGCSSEPPPPPPPPTEPSATAPDELAPGELAEGPMLWLGLPLPAAFRIAELTPTYSRSRGRVPLEAAANYVRERVDAANVLTGPTKTVFDDVKVKRPRGKPLAALEHDAGSREVIRIEVSRLRGETIIIAQRMLRPVFKEGLSDAERWERTGLTVDGKPVDPNKFE